MTDDPPDAFEDSCRNNISVKLGDPVTSVCPIQSGALLQAGFHVAFAAAAFGAD